MKDYQQILMDFSLDRPVMAENNTSQRLMNLLKSEVLEAEESLHDPVELARELADIIIFTLGIANLHGFDMDKEVREKIAFNHTRYTADLFQSGDYEESRKKAKEFEKSWKKLFYEI